VTLTETITSSITPAIATVAGSFAFDVPIGVLFGSFVGAFTTRVFAPLATRPANKTGWAYAVLGMIAAIMLGVAFAGIVGEWFASFDFVKSELNANRAAGVVVAGGAQAIVEVIQQGPKALLARWSGAKEAS
jgi:hypothetical protein